MSQKVATPAMTRYLTKMHEENAEATLGDARKGLQQQSAAASPEAAAQREQLVAEIDELIADHTAECLAGDFVPPDNANAVGGANVHG